jgi:hypothetical protein
MATKINTYFEAVLKQAGFDGLVARKINGYREYHEQKRKLVLNFYEYLTKYNATLIIRANGNTIYFNPIEKFSILYENSTLIEGFIAKANTGFEIVRKQFRSFPRCVLEFEKSTQNKLCLGWLFIKACELYICL